MINYTDTENILDLLYIEKSSLKSTLDIQNNLNKQILTFMKNFLGKLDVNSSTSSDVLNYINCFRKSFIIVFYFVFNFSFRVFI